MDLKRLAERLSALGEPPYRARQVWEWASGGAPGYEAMTNLPRALRTALEADVPFSTLVAEAEQRSSDGTVKTLFRTHDGHPVEAVLMRYRDGRRSVCVSSQSGCPLTCTFCATGRMTFGRNLTASEILDARFLEVAEARTQRPLPAPGQIVRLLVGVLMSHIVDIQLLVQVWGQVPINPGLKRMASEIGDRIRVMFADYLTDWHAQTLPVEQARVLAERQGPVYMGLVQGYVMQTVLFDGFDGEAYLDAVGMIAFDA